jgi:hypothetical protein
LILEIEKRVLATSVAISMESGPRRVQPSYGRAVPEQRYTRGIGELGDLRTGRGTSLAAGGHIGLEFKRALPKLTALTNGVARLDVAYDSVRPRRSH